MKLVGLILILFGETLAILTELTGAKYTGDTFSTRLFFRLLALMIIAGAFLLAGYMLGFINFKNIWIVSAVSITSILIIEPVLNYFYLNQLPTRGALIGFILGVIGLISTFVF